MVAAEIQALFYGNPMSALVGGSFDKADVVAFLAEGTTKKLANMHGDTWTFDEGEPTVTSFKNQLTGKDYYTQFVPGDESINFSIGEWDFATKADFQGGVATSTQWTPPQNKGAIYKTIVAFTKDGVCIVFPKANITGRTSMIESVLAGIAVTAAPNETGITGIPSEAWFNDPTIVIPQT